MDAHWTGSLSDNLLLRLSSTEAHRALCDHDEHYKRLGQKAVTRRLKDALRH
jgi:hypothetical protein